MSKKFNVSELVNVVINFFEAVEACKHFKSCQFGHGFIARSTPKFVAPKKTANEWFSAFGYPMPNIIKVSKVVNARSYSYGDAVNRQLSKQGAEPNFESGAMNGYEWVVKDIIKRATKDGSYQFCHTFKKNDKTETKTIYITTDQTPRIVVGTELEFVKSHLYKAPSSPKQTSFGIADEDVVMVRNYKFSNLIAVGTTPQIEEIWQSITE